MRKPVKLAEKKLAFILNVAASRRLLATTAATSSSGSGKEAISNNTNKQDLKQAQDRPNASISEYIMSTMNATSNSLYQEYTKYYSLISATLSVMSPSSLLSSANQQSQQYSSSSTPSTSTTVVAPAPPKRLDLHDLIKPLIDLTTSSLSSITSSSEAAAAETKKTTTTTTNLIKSQIQVKLSNEARLVELVDSLRRASSLLIKSEVVADLVKLLYAAPELRFAVDRKRLPILAQLVELKKLNAAYALKRKEDKRLEANINQCLALLGYFDESEIKHAGINILAIDGGGAKGFVAIEILKNIERHCGRPIHQVFDYICGTSTGACIAALIAIYKLSLDEIEKQYKIFVKEIFSRNRAAGIGNLVMSYSYYDTQAWENMLKEALGDRLVINSAKDSSSCKISIVSNMTTANQMKIFLFRNYNLPPGSQSQYDGTCRYKVWEAIRASTAAPAYYQEFELDGCIFYDGGVLANNPTAIALHECRHLWPRHTMPNCVVSIGNGRFQPALDDAITTTTGGGSGDVHLRPAPISASPAATTELSLRQKVNRIVAGVSSTETVHNMLIDLLPGSVYYRFNPYMSEEFSLDENRPNKWKLMQYETSMYMRRNQVKFEMASKQLCKEKSPWQKLEQVVKRQINK